MAAEDDILKTLLRIEKLLGNSSATTGAGGRTPVTRANIAGGRSDQQRDKAGAKTFRATSVALEALEGSTDLLNSRFIGLSKTVRNTRENFIAMNRSMRAATRGAPTAKVTGGPEDTQALLGQLLGNYAGRRNPLIQSFNDLNTSVRPAKVAFVAALWELASVVKPIINDFFALHRVGIAGSAALSGMYVDAIKMGMSLKDYTALLIANSNAVVRFGNMREFNDTLFRTNKQLLGIGIFGEEAAKLSGALTSSTVSLGIPMDRMNGAMDAQIQTFARLRKTSLLTADGFQQIITELGNNADVQAELLGLGAEQRAQRFAEIAQTRTLGLSLGMTKEQSDKLGQALLETRKLTAVQRFGAAGRIRQAGAITGMDAGQSEELARLARKKRRTPEEDALFLQLGGTLQAGIERMMNSGDISQENIAEQLQEQLNSTGIGKALEAAGQARLSQDAGQAGVNKDFAQGSQKLSQAAQMLLEYATYAKGLAENPIVSAITSALGSSAFALGIGTVIGKVLGRAAPAAGAAASAAPGMLTQARSAAGGVMNTVTGMFKQLTDVGKMGPTVSQAGQSIVNGVRTFGTGVLEAGKQVVPTISKFGSTIAQGANTLVGKAQVSYELLKNAGFSKLGAVWEMVTKTIGSFASGASGVVSNAASTTAQLGKTLLGGVGSILKGAFGFLGKGGVVAGLVGGVMELFTGDLGSALNADDGSTWFEGGLKGFVEKAQGKIGDIIGGIIRGFAVGITSLGDGLISVWNWTVGSFFENMKIDLGASLTNLFDQTWTSMIIMFKELKLKAAKFFGMTDTAKAIEADIEVAKKAQAELAKNGQATLGTIGDANQKLAAEQKAAAEKTKENVGVATKNVAVAAGVVTSTKDLTKNLIATAQAVPGATADAAKVAANPALAAPGQTPRPAVTPPAVNTPTTAAPAGQPATGEKPASLTPSTMEMLSAQFAQIIDLLQKSLVAEQAQAAFAEAMASSRNVRVPFANNEELGAMVRLNIN